MNERKIKKLRNKTLFLIFIIIAVIGGLRTYDDLNRNSEILMTKNNQIIKDIEHIYYDELDNIEKTLEINLQILSSSSTVKKLLKSKNREELYNFTRSYYDKIKNNYNGVNIMHYHFPDHSSFLRIHKKHLYGDNLKDVRLMITKAINEKKIIKGYEHGKHDKNMFTYRIAYPIFDGKKLLSVLEIGFDTSYINQKITTHVKELYDRNVDIITIIKQDTLNFKEFSSLKGKFQDYIYKSDPLFDKIIHKADLQNAKNKLVKIDSNHYLLKHSSINLINGLGKPIGSFLFIADMTQDIEQNQKFFYSSLAKPIVAIIIILLLVFGIFSFFYKRFLSMEKRTRTILDTQSSLIILTDGEELLDCNNALLGFYGFDTLEQFKLKYDCICDSFEEGENLLQKYNDGVLWLNYMLEHPQAVHKVGIKDTNGKLNIFNITLNKCLKDEILKEELYYVATLTNISDLEKANLQLLEQSKQVALGEMIGNIAHQWRQPLSVISTAATGSLVQKDLGVLSDDELRKKLVLIDENSQYLSETIDTFRNYIMEKKDRKDVYIQDRLNLALNITKATLTDNHIEIINNVDNKEKIKVNIVVGELSQVLINILNNAKDALVHNNIKEPKIVIDLELVENNVVITIEDNGGGIPDDIINKVFDPYFTTKHKAQGTGLGLHMSYKIITESLRGKLYVENVNEGAKFYIELPLR